MYATVLERHCQSPSDLVWYDDWGQPTPRADEVLVRVEACSLNHHDLFTMRGMPGIRIPLPLIMGIDIVGVVETIGREVDRRWQGLRVLVDPYDPDTGQLVGETRNGGLAEYCTVQASSLIELPDSVDSVSASMIPTAYGTALRMLRSRADVMAGERVLVLGASGGVGSACVQIASAMGAEVVAATSQPQLADQLRDLGAAHVCDYSTQPFVESIHELFGKPRIRGGGGVDVVVNFTGGETWVPSLRSLRKGGRLVTCGATTGYDPRTDIRFIWSFELNILGSDGWSRSDLSDLLGWLEEGRLAPRLHRVVPLRAATEGLDLLAQRQAFGKVVVVPDGISS